MSNVKLDDTIVAISTPIGEGGIGIVRLSGRDALKIADRIFLSKNGKKPSGFRTYTVHYGHIYESRPALLATDKNNGQKGGTRTTNPERRIIDEVLLTVMRAPKSYTKEDVVEINCHSGIVPLRKILDLILKEGARLASPGEFTKRAFLNGRIDILQAESVLDIIKAKTDLSLRAAVNNLGGLFSKKIEDIRERLMDILASVEASIDFSEEPDVEGVGRRKVYNSLKRVEMDIEKLISRAHEGKVLRQGIKVVICGSPNVGKSSLMNALLKEPRAIVTHIPGTTRDTIEEVVNIKGIGVVLVDTAGISITNHPVEKEGIRRSHVSIQGADLVLLILDYGRRLNRLDLALMRKIRGRVIVVVNKKDLKKRINIGRVRSFLRGKLIVYTSAINLSGIDKLECLIRDMVFKGKLHSPDLVTGSNDRQLELLHRSVEDVKEAIKSIKIRLPMDCVSIYLRSAVENIGEVTGHTVTEEALDRIFSEFCIGK